MVQGDYIYMPGIVGTANGNDEYSVAYTYHYMYGIKNGKVELNREPYFWRERVYQTISLLRALLTLGLL